jgi:PAS domain S-box-containing protein
MVAMTAAMTRASPAYPLDTQSSDVFRLLVDSVRDYAVFLLNPDGIVASWNAGAEHIKGWQAEEIIGKHFSVFYTDDAVAKGWPDEELRRARQAGRFEDEGWRVRSDGSRIWANVVITPLYGTGGDLIGFSKITRDLSERRMHEEKLRQSEESLRLLVEGAHEHAVFLLDEDGGVKSWNAGAQRMLGFESEEVLGRDSAMFCTGTDIAADKPAQALSDAKSAGYSTALGWRMRRDGTRFWAEVTITALRDRDGKPRGFAQMVRDLSQRQRLQELETEGQRINEFIAMLAHELRNPLAPISNAVGILDKVAGTPEQAWCTRMIGRQVAHMARLVDDLLDVSRITSGKIRLRREPLELNALVQSAVEAMRAAMDAGGHHLELHLAEEPVRLMGDATRLNQVVTNLLTNAAKYTPPGGHIQVSVAHADGEADIRVADNGIGMSRELIDTAFDLFVQGDRALDRAEGGLGIGLSLVKRIVALHGGTVAAASAGAGQGSDFTVRLPLQPWSAIASPSGLAAGLAPKARRVLVVDDNEDAADSLATLLQMSGHEVTLASDGPAALRVAAAAAPDVVLLDIGLPGMDGYEVARRLRELPALASVRLVAMTGYAQERHKEAGLRAGFHAHLVKPVDPDQLLGMIAAPD